MVLFCLFVSAGQGNEPPHNSASFVVVPNVNNTNDSTFAIIDGGKSLESADAIRAVLADIVDEEYILQQEGLEEGGSLSQEDVLERLQYLRQSMLSFHRHVTLYDQSQSPSFYMFIKYMNLRKHREYIRRKLMRIMRLKPIELWMRIQLDFLSSFSPLLYWARQLFLAIHPSSVTLGVFILLMFL